MGSLVQILNQFGPLESELREKQRYAVWRSADIRKALREGRAVTPRIVKAPPPQESAAPVPVGGTAVRQEGAAVQGDASDLPLAYAEMYDGRWQR